MSYKIHKYIIYKNLIIVIGLKILNRIYLLNEGGFLKS